MIRPSRQILSQSKRLQITRLGGHMKSVVALPATSLPIYYNKCHRELHSVTPAPSSLFSSTLQTPSIITSSSSFSSSSLQSKSLQSRSYCSKHASLLSSFNYFNTSPMCYLADGASSYVYIILSLLVF